MAFVRFYSEENFIVNSSYNAVIMKSNDNPYYCTVHYSFVSLANNSLQYGIERVSVRLCGCV